MRRILAGLLSLMAGLLWLTSSPLAGVPEHDVPIRLVLALDTSDSLKTNDPYHLFPTSAALMVHLLEERDSLGLLRFDATPSVVLEPGPLTRSRRQRALRELEHRDPEDPTRTSRPF